MQYDTVLCNTAQHGEVRCGACSTVRCSTVQYGAVVWYYVALLLYCCAYCCMYFSIMFYCCIVLPWYVALLLHCTAQCRAVKCSAVPHYRCITYCTLPLYGTLPFECTAFVVLCICCRRLRTSRDTKTHALASACVSVSPDVRNLLQMHITFCRVSAGGSDNRCPNAIFRHRMIFFRTPEC